MMISFLIKITKIEQEWFNTYQLYEKFQSIYLELDNKFKIKL